MAFLRKMTTTIAVVAVVATACGEEAGDDRPRGTVVDTARVGAMDVPATIAAVGTVEADHRTDVSAEVSGRVARIVRDEGSPVAAGAPVIQLDAGSYADEVNAAAAELARARATLEADEKLLERYEKLIEAGAIDPQTFEDVEARVKSERASVQQARASLASARRDLAKTTVRAPFGGIVGKRLVDLGQYVGAQEPLFELVDPQPVRIRFEVPETHAMEVESGDQIRFRVRSDTVSTRVAEVDYVSPQIDPETRTFEVTAEYSNPDLGVRPGSFADVILTTSVHEGAPVVPEEALYTEGTENFVYVMVDSLARKRRVTLGSRFEGLVEIRSGIEPGAVVLTAGQQGLPDGAQVRVAPGREAERLGRE